MLLANATWLTRWSRISSPANASLRPWCVAWGCNWLRTMSQPAYGDMATKPQSLDTDNEQRVVLDQRFACRFALPLLP